MAILENASKIQEEFKQQPRQLDYLYGIMKDLFIDWHKFKGSNVKSKVGQLEQLLMAYEPNTVIGFILSGQFPR